MNRSVFNFLLTMMSVAAVAGDHLGGPSFEGREIVCDLPQDMMLRNSGGNDNPDGSNPRHEPGKGSGLCVFTSLNRAAFWQNNGVLADLRDWMEHYEGGGYPEKVDRMIAKKYAEYKKAHPDAEPPQYIQNTTGDMGLMKLALKTRRMVCCTYGYSPRYASQRNPKGIISHMVCVAYVDDAWVCVQDNNFPGRQENEWVQTPEFERRFKHGGGGWQVVLLDVPAPPVPNK